MKLSIPSRSCEMIYDMEVNAKVVHCGSFLNESTRYRIQYLKVNGRKDCFSGFSSSLHDALLIKRREMTIMYAHIVKFLTFNYQELSLVEHSHLVEDILGFQIRRDVCYPMQEIVQYWTMKLFGEQEIKEELKQTNIRFNNYPLRSQYVVLSFITCIQDEENYRMFDHEQMPGKTVESKLFSYYSLICRL